MSLINWNLKGYSVGLSAMDEEHRILVGLINALDQNRGKNKSAKLDRIFSTLDFYVKNHFSHEERILERIKYPRIEQHRKQHKKFILSLNNMKKAFDAGEVTDEFIGKVLSFLKDWLVNHIMIEDKDYGTYLTK